MFKKTKKLFQIKNNKMSINLILLSLALWGQNALAKMPKIDDPTQGKKSGFLANMQAYIYDGFVFGGLIIVGGVFIVAAKNIIVEYNNIGEGKGSWAKLGTLVVIGIVLVVACIWLATLAAETLQD